MSKNLVYFGICFTLVWTAIRSFAVRKTRLTTCSSGSLTLQPHEALRNVHVSSIDDIAWKYWFSHGHKWIEVVHYNRSMVCFISRRLLPDGTKVLSCTNRSVTVEHSFESSFRNLAKYLFEGHLLDGSVVHHIYEVDFVVCIHRRKDANLNVTEFLVNLLPWKQVIDMDFFDTNYTALAYCNRVRCQILINTSKIEATPPLYWIKRLDDSGGSLVLNRLQKDDNRRKIVVKVRHLTDEIETVLVETLMFLITASQEPTSTITSTVTMRSRLSPSKTIAYSRFVSVSRPLIKNIVKASSWSSVSVGASASYTTLSLRSSVSDCHRKPLWGILGLVFVTMVAYFL